MIHLLNAAVMPHEGNYELKAISPAQFGQEVAAAHASGNFRHYIGYQDTLAIINDLCGIDLGEINVDQTEFEDGDIFYVARLRRRVSPLSKRVRTHRPGTQLEIEDFDFFRGRYTDLAGSLGAEGCGDTEDKTLYVS